MQTDFIALYRGQTVSEARIIAITQSQRSCRALSANLQEVPRTSRTATDSLSTDRGR